MYCHTKIKIGDNSAQTSQSIILSIRTLKIYITIVCVTNSSLKSVSHSDLVLWVCQRI